MRTLVIGLALAGAAVIEAQTPTGFRRGELVTVRHVKKPATLKIVGLPDEIVEANDAGVFIDDVPVTGFSREFLTRNRVARQYIPMDHYLVMGEERLEQDISEYFGIDPADSIERAK